MTKLTEITQKAFDLGTEAYIAGQTCIPAHDSSLCELLKDNSNLPALPLLKAWNEGWHKANLSDPFTDIFNRDFSIRVIFSKKILKGVSKGQIIKNEMLGFVSEAAVIDWIKGVKDNCKDWEFTHIRVDQKSSSASSIKLKLAYDVFARSLINWGEIEI